MDVTEMYSSLEEVKADFSLLNEEFEKIKSKEGVFKYPDYTNDRFAEINNLINNSDFEEPVRINKAWSLMKEIRKIHFTGKLSVKHILTFANSSEVLLRFSKYCTELDDEEYWRGLADAYITQDYESISYEIIRSLFCANRNKKECLMNEEESSFFKSLPQKIKVYRAMTLKESESGKFRFSWTLDEEIAENFLERNSMIYDEEMTIHEMEIDKSDALAYFKSRNEEEIIYLKK
ncbi:hypothetical protein [Zunongwangia pacifica]|uniref:Uncharacterized protein n=1 Tax=Zunongwangia pacifica TaxID=2911062 RepID=A0A9X1ZUB6_9FLAO|nr:hypothetical protein [Zunongwangia pacifica]MCL6218593.1 hypothetical protein [Zunongwangia pacifica]